MVAIEIVLTVTALVVLVLLVMVIDLREECSVMRAEINYLDNCRKVLYDTLYEHLKPTFCTACLICDEIIEEYGDPICKYPVICDECKEAVKFAKWLRTGRGTEE